MSHSYQIAIETHIGKVRLLNMLTLEHALSL